VFLVPSDPDNAGQRLAGRRLVAAAAGVLVAAVLAGILIVPTWLPGLMGNQPAREGTLAGNDVPVPSSAASAEQVPADGEPAGTVPAETTLSIDFDAGRMGEGLGSGWAQTFGGPEAVALAPFPTAVDRSARLVSIDVAGAEACRSIAPRTVRVTRLLVDVLLSEPNTTAVLIARDAAGDTALDMSLGGSGGTLAIDGADPVGTTGGLPTDQWVRAEISPQDGQTLWRVSRGPRDNIIEQTIEVEGLSAIQEVCLAVPMDSTGAAHFDNLAIVIPEER
jgi:hypothetical protein